MMPDRLNEPGWKAPWLWDDSTESSLQLDGTSDEIHQKAKQHVCIPQFSTTHLGWGFLLTFNKMPRSNPKHQPGIFISGWAGNRLHHFYHCFPNIHDNAMFEILLLEFMEAFHVQTSQKTEGPHWMLQFHSNLFQQNKVLLARTKGGTPDTKGHTWQVQWDHQGSHWQQCTLTGGEDTVH